MRREERLWLHGQAVFELVDRIGGVRVSEAVLPPNGDTPNHTHSEAHVIVIREGSIILSKAPGKDNKPLSEIRLKGEFLVIQSEELHGLKAGNMGAKFLQVDVPPLTIS